MRTERLLRALGLDDAATRTYLALLDGPPSTIAEITRRSGLHRPSVYRALSVLRSKGLLESAPRGKRQCFIAAPPETLRTLFGSLISQMELVLPELEQRARASGRRPTLRVLEGVEGIREALRDVVRSLPPHGVYYRYSAASAERDAERYMPAEYRRLRDTKKLERFVLTNATRARSYRPRLERAVKVVPKGYGLFDDNVSLIIYGDRVASLDYTAEVATIVESASIASFHRQIFRMLFDLL